ncbi:2OG-Fe(II) oxygenase [Dactylosporangium sp. CA-052675]|uniref:2OG-Fe(II) oxygenase n=1 Tax=Dactylosporangium sp. CA-052675 TaxID=3239927 RepID=UPI003D8CA4C9
MTISAGLDDVGCAPIGRLLEDADCRELVFPLQVVIGLSGYGTDYTGGEFMLTAAWTTRCP